jgi:antitoxin (DNA-binding transcriptional repressor) of toxin-antitoxin stability system
LYGNNYVKYVTLYNLIMVTISATELARRLGDFLGRVRYRGESFVVERNGVAVAKVVPATEAVPPSLAKALAVWGGSGLQDAGFAADLERVNATDKPPKNPWAS